MKSLKELIEAEDYRLHHYEDCFNEGHIRMDYEHFLRDRNSEIAKISDYQLKVDELIANYSDDETMQDVIAFWQKCLINAITLRDLPTDYESFKIRETAKRRSELTAVRHELREYIKEIIQEEGEPDA